jgi:threonine/homoserine/homoserine lactone efflux protein
VFYLALLPQFIGADDPVLAKSLLLTAIHAVEGIVWFAIVSFLVDRSRRLFMKPLLRRWIDWLCGAFLVALGVRLALQRQ